jgi:charged multivesicular body protein 7
VLMVHLARDQAAIAYDSTSGTIKFKNPSETAPLTIEQEDISIASLRTLIASLEPQIDMLTKQVTELDAKAREAVAQKQFITAKTALRQKKLADSKLHQRTATLAQLDEIYAKIEQAADQVEMVRMMQTSSQALRSLNQKTGGVEKVQDVMEGLREEMMNADEIQQAVNEVSAGAVDEGEVEDELEALERVEREKVEAVERAEREKREAAEKVEREKREAEEAETTRARLAELDSIGVKEPTGAGELQRKSEALEPAASSQ